MSIKRVTSIILIAGAVALAMGVVPGSAAHPPASDLSPASAAAQRLGAELLLSPSPQCDSGHQLMPAVAYNPAHQEYLVAWYNIWSSGKSDVYARRVSESGELLSWFCVASGLGSGGDGKSRGVPSVAYNAAADEYLIVWMYEVSTDVYEIWGRIIAWNGGYMKPEFLIFAWPNRTFDTPRVAWNSARNEYLVIWNAVDTGTGQYNDVAGCRVSAAGVVQPGAPIIITASNQPQQADLVYSAALDGYMVVWTRTGATTGTDIYGVLLDPDGAKITPPGEFVIYDGPGDQSRPAVTANVEDRYMVAWSDQRSGNWDIYGRMFRANGDPVTDPFALASTTDTEESPDVAANAADQYLTAWKGLSGSQTIVTARLRDSGALMASVNLSPPSSGYVSDAPSVACDVPGCLIAYTKILLSGYIHIYGRRYWPQAVYLPLVLRNH